MLMRCSRLIGRPRVWSNAGYRGHLFHANAGVAMAINACAPSSARFALPQSLAIEHRQHAGVGRIVVLHGFCLWTKIGIARTTLIERDFSPRGDDGKNGEQAGNGRRRSQNRSVHSTTIWAVSV